MPTRRNHPNDRRPAPTNLSDLNIDSELSESGPVEERREATRNRHSPAVLALTILATIGVVAYTIFLLQIDNRGDLLRWLLVIGAELGLVFLGLMSRWTIFSFAGRQTNRRSHEMSLTMRCRSSLCFRCILPPSAAVGRLG